MQILEGENGKNEDFWKNNRLIDGGKEESFAGRLSRAEDEADNGGVFYPPCMADTGENAEREGGKRGEIAPRVRPADGAL